MQLDGAAFNRLVMNAQMQMYLALELQMTELESGAFWIPCRLNWLPRSRTYMAVRMSRHDDEQTYLDKFEMTASLVLERQMLIDRL
jgi:hypothetical protein